MSKTKKENISITPDEWELARKKSLVKFGYVNRSGYIRQLIVNDETYAEGFKDVKEFKRFKNES